jgi:hypothetical protein
MGASEKTPTAENRWYVLATLAGEQPDDINYDLHEKNRDYWNAWASQNMTEEEKANVKNITVARLLWDAPERSSVKDEVEKLFKARLPNATLPDPSEIVDFRDVEFANIAVFNGFFFSAVADFDRATFSAEADFSSAIFSAEAYFNSATFSAEADFASATFSAMAIFDITTFSAVADFASATFSAEARFSGVTFSGRADFDSATFSAKAHFISATFSAEAYFDSATFSAEADFYSATFSVGAHFYSTAFSGPSKFVKTNFKATVSFNDAVFEAPCNLREAKFEKFHPDLEGTLLHSKTNVSAKSMYWPPAKISQSDEAALNSCAHLRQNMASQGLNEAAHFFFRREMNHKAHSSRFWERPFYAIYRFSEYGYGVKQPSLAIVLLWLAGALSLVYWGGMQCAAALGLSFANIFRFFGFQRVYFESGTIKDLNMWLEIMTGSQTVIGYFLLFLLGLGLRNRFRLK